MNEIMVTIAEKDPRSGGIEHIEKVENKKQQNKHWEPLQKFNVRSECCFETWARFNRLTV